MWKYATRRVLTMIPILIGVSMVVFLLVASLPGDAVDAHAGRTIPAAPTTHPITTNTESRLTENSPCVKISPIFV